MGNRAGKQVSRSLKWLPEALKDLARLRDFIRVHNPEAAQRAATRILDAAHKLLILPNIGHPVLNLDTPQLRDLFLPFGQAGYWLRYYAADHEIIVVRVWRGREDRDPARTL